MAWRYRLTTPHMYMRCRLVVVECCRPQCVRAFATMLARLIAALEILQIKRVEPPPRKHGNIAL